MILDREAILGLLPHRDPMVFVDRVTEMEPGTRAVGELEVHADAFWAKGHFPGRPIMPGVLITEALAQLAAIVHLADCELGEDAAVFLVGMDGMRFRRPVEPDCTLELEVEKQSLRRGIFTFSGEARVDGKRVANGRFMAAVQGANG